MRTDLKPLLNLIQKEDKALLNKAELGRRFNCDPRTIDRYLKLSAGEIEPVPTRKYTSKLDGFKDIIDSKVDNYGCSAMGVYKFIVKKGYAGKYSILANYVREHKDAETKKATIRFETNPGLQGQVDWKEEMKLTNKSGDIISVNFFIVVLGYSRYKYIELTSDRAQETLLRCLMNAFMYFGGVPQELLFDNMKTVVDQAKTTFTQTVFNDVFQQFSKDTGFKPLACFPYRPQTKGKVETVSKLINRLKAYNEEFETWEDLQKITAEFLGDINDEMHQGINAVPAQRFKKEKEYLLPKPDPTIMYGYISDQEEKTYRVNRESMIKYEGRKYSVPTRYIGERLTASADDSGNLNIYYNGNFVISHVISEKMYNYTVGTACEILKSDAMKRCTDAEILAFVQNSLLKMDKVIGE